MDSTEQKDKRQRHTRLEQRHIGGRAEKQARGGGAVAGAQVQPLCVSEASLGHSHLISYFRTVGPL